ncbi:hypothetical protein L345_18084, partial [Ophiophagus hannah]
YTTKCYNHQSTTPETTEICPDSGYFCYKSSWIDGRVFFLLEPTLELPNAPENWRSRRTCLCPAWVPLRSHPVARQSKQCKERGSWTVVPRLSQQQPRLEGETFFRGRGREMLGEL